MDSRKFEKLGHVSSDYTVSKKDYDIRGWTVIGSQGEKIGHVAELIFDKDKKMVRYLELDIDVSFPLTVKKNILVPNEFATIHGHNQIVALHQIGRPLISNYPEYKGGEINKDYELLIRDFLAGNVNAQEGFSENLESPGKVDKPDSNVEESLNSTISKLKTERDLAVAERDFAIEEKEELKKKLDTILSEDFPESKPDDSNYLDCDDFETGRKC